MTQSQQLAQTIDQFVTTRDDIYNTLQIPTMALGFKGGLYWCVEQLQHNGVMTQQEALTLLGILEEEDTHAND